MNKVVLLGYIGRDIDVRYTADGTAIANMPIVVRRHTNKDGEKKYDWIDITFFGRKAEKIFENTKRGSRICVSGKIRVRSWETEGGKKRYKTYVYVDDFTVIDWKEPKETASQVTEQIETYDDDVPF